MVMFKELELIHYYTHRYDAAQFFSVRFYADRISVVSILERQLVLELEDPLMVLNFYTVRWLI